MERLDIFGDLEYFEADKKRQVTVTCCSNEALVFYINYVVGQ